MPAACAKLNFIVLKFVCVEIPMRLDSAWISVVTQLLIALLYFHHTKQALLSRLLAYCNFFDTEMKTTLFNCMLKNRSKKNRLRK
jgi:hypothetical protein